MKRAFPLKTLLALIIVGAVGVTVAAMVLVGRSTRTPTPTISSWRSIDHPVPDQMAEAAVYSAVMQHLHSEDRFRMIVVRDHTLRCRRGGALCSREGIKNAIPELKPETLADYIYRHEESVPITNSFKLHRPVMLLSDEELQKLLIRANVQVDFNSLPSRKINWSGFYDRYPLSPGVISFSRIGFNSQFDQALVYEEEMGSDNGTWGRHLLLTREPAGSVGSHLHGGWVVRNKVESWFPEDPRPSIQQGEIGTLKGSILDAKAEGLDKVELSSILCGWEIGNLQQALGRDSLVLASVVGMKTFANAYGLVTWYKFTMVESLSEKPMPKFPGYETLNPPPPEMQPLADNEFVIAEVNGQIVIDGVTVTQYSNGVNYSPGQTYLIFLHISPDRVGVRSGTDPLGVFLVDKDGTFTPYIDQPHPLQQQLAKRFGNSIENLRNALKN